MTARRLVRGACPHDCPDTCGVITEVEDDRAVAFYADSHNPVTDGWLCAKVRPYLEHVYHPDRLQFPLRRVGSNGGGQWQRITWAEALAEIGARWRAIMAEYGAEAILPYSYSGTLGLVNMTVANGRFWNRLGVSQLERSICGEAAAFAVNRTLGARHSPPYEQVLDSRLVILWGHNPVSTAPHFMPFLRRAQRQGCQVVVIDPRRTRTAQGADWHIAPRPATDGALALGVGQVIVAEGWHDEAWLAQYTVGWPELRARLAEFPPERVAEITGVATDDIVKLARLYATTRPGMIKSADGLQRHPNGGQTFRALLMLPALTGQYGARGGGLAYSTGGYLQWDSEAVNKWVECPPPGRVVNMNRLGAALLGEVSDPPIKSLYVFGANPATSSPNAGLIVQGLQREDLFTVVHELFMTDSAEFADILLPATSQLEQTDLHKAYGHTQLTYNAQAIPPLGECKSNWEVMTLLAREMGLAESWLSDSAETVIAEVLTATARHQPALQGITLDALKAQGAIPLHIQPEVPFADGRFPTPSGKVELFSHTLAQLGLDPLPGWTPAEDAPGRPDAPQAAAFPALTLISGAAHHFVSSSFANHPDFLRHEGETFVEINPQDSAERGIQPGQLVTIANGRGAFTARARVTDAVRPGVVVSPKGRWANHSGGRHVNWTTSDALGDMVGQSTFHTNLVWVTPVVAAASTFG